MRSPHFHEELRVTLLEKAKAIDHSLLRRKSEKSIGKKGGGCFSKWPPDHMEGIAMVPNDPVFWPIFLCWRTSSLTTISLGYVLIESFFSRFMALEGDYYALWYEISNQIVLQSQIKIVGT